MLRKFLAILGFAFSTSCASATVITVDFQDLLPGIYFENVTSSGFTFSPSCHIDVLALAESQVVGWDTSGCQDKANTKYLGARPVSNFSYLYVDYGGRPFSFLSYDHRGVPFSIFSSKGGAFDQTWCSPWERDCSTFNTYMMDGPDWTGVKWILFGYSDPGAPAAQLDKLVFRVPSPGTGVLVLSGGLLLWISGRRVPNQMTKIRCSACTHLFAGKPAGRFLERGLKTILYRSAYQKRLSMAT